MRVHSPSNSQRVAGVFATGVFLLAGGWLASQASYAASAESAVETAGESATGQTSEGGVNTSPVADSSSGGPNPAAAGESLTVALSGLRNGNGMVHVALFDDPAAFAAYDWDRALDIRSVSASAASSVAFSGLGAGPFAVSVHHDENGDGNFDMTGAYPLEGYGTSRATSAYDEPGFDEASVEPGDVAVQVFYIE